MDHWTIRFSFAILSATLAAQVNVAVRTVTPMLARTASGPQTIASGVLLNNGQGVTSTYNPGFCFASATAYVTFSGGNSPSASFASAVSTGQVGPCTGGSVDAGSHSIRVSLTSTQPLAGSLLISATCFRYSSWGGGADFRVDVGDDRSVELQGDAGFPPTLTAFLEMPVTLDSIPLHILIGQHAYNPDPFGSARAGVDVNVDFRPGPGRVGLIGAPCGAMLIGRLIENRGYRLELAVQGAPATPHTFLCVGSQDLNLVLPPTQCLLRTDLAAALPVVLSNGSGSWSVP